MASNDAASRELAPTGKLRVAIAVGPSASALWTVRDPATGKPKGVPIELGTAMAQKLGVPVELIEYTSSGEIVASRDKGAWDVTWSHPAARSKRWRKPTARACALRL